MLLDVALSDDFVALLIRARDGQFHHEPANRNIWLELPDDSLITQRALGRLPDTVNTKQIVATGSLYRIVENVKTNRTQPPIVRQRTRREIAELHVGISGR